MLGFALPMLLWLISAAVVYKCAKLFLGYRRDYGTVLRSLGFASLTLVWMAPYIYFYDRSKTVADMLLPFAIGWFFIANVLATKASVGSRVLPATGLAIVAVLTGLYMSMVIVGGLMILFWM